MVRPISPFTVLPCTQGGMHTHTHEAGHPLRVPYEDFEAYRIPHKEESTRPLGL